MMTETRLFARKTAEYATTTSVEASKRRRRASRRRAARRRARVWERERFRVPRHNTHTRDGNASQRLARHYVSRATTGSVADECARAGARRRAYDTLPVAFRVSRASRLSRLPRLRTEWCPWGRSPCPPPPGEPRAGASAETDPRPRAGGRTGWPSRSRACPGPVVVRSAAGSEKSE